MVKLTFLLGLGAAALFASSFQNGGFESPLLKSSPDFVTVPTGWTKVDPTCPSCFALFMEFYGTFGLPTIGAEGTQAYGFGGNGGTTGSLSQTFDTVAGANYEVSFQYVIQQGPEFEDLQADVLDGINTLATKAIRFNNAAWVTTTLDFTAASASTTLRFSDTTGAVDPGTGSGTNWALDAVSVSQLGGGGGAVPEPSTWVLAGLGTLAVGGLRRFKARP